jgi:hypothetical protein
MTDARVHEGFDFEAYDWTLEHNFIFLFKCSPLSTVEGVGMTACFCEHEPSKASGT